jgi:hypothetical protein
VPFDYKKKGKKIPPPKERKPHPIDYTYIAPSANAFKSEFKPREQ